MPPVTSSQSSGDTPSIIEYTAKLALLPNTGAQAMTLECTTALHALAGQFIVACAGRGLWCMPNPVLLNTVLYSKLSHMHSVLPSFIHSFNIRGSLSQKGLRLEIRPQHEEGQLLDYRIRADGTEEGDFGHVPDTRRSMLRMGQRSDETGTRTGVWNYIGGEDAVAVFHNQTQVDVDPAQTTRYRNLIKNFPERAAQTTSQAAP